MKRVATLFLTINRLNENIKNKKVSENQTLNKFIKKKII